jgi:hypothetical protein
MLIAHMKVWTQRNICLLVVAMRCGAALQDEIGAAGVTDSKLDIKDLTVFYKAAKKRFDTDPDFKLRAQGEVVKLQVPPRQHDDSKHPFIVLLIYPRRVAMKRI